MDKEEKKKLQKRQRVIGIIFLLGGMLGILYNLDDLGIDLIIWISLIIVGGWHLYENSKGRINVISGTNTSTQFSGPICHHCRRKVEIGTSKCPHLQVI